MMKKTIKISINKTRRSIARTAGRSLDIAKTSVVKTAGRVKPVPKSPDEGLGQLFSDVQQRQVYSDGKTFVDLVPRRRMKQIQQEYLLERKDPNFSLHEFLNRHFYEFNIGKSSYTTKPDSTMRNHISDVWKVLERRNRVDRGSLIALPHKYVVPGGRFSEQFYWDSYFIMLGLAADKKWGTIEGMMKNYAYMIRKFGFIPTANRTYFLSRSQPPFFSHMVKLLARHKGRRTIVEYLPYLVAEHKYWMKGKASLEQTEHAAYRRVVKMKSGMLLNRYHDDKVAPRPESLREDIMTAREAEGRDPDRLYLHLRAAAESGWDFSSRWFHDPSDIRTIHTADIIPVDLNALMYHLEQTIAEGYRLLRNAPTSRRYALYAERRARAISEYCWDDEQNFFIDYNFHTKQATGVLSLAGVFPLYAKIATTKQAAAVAERIRQDFLKDGGLVSTLIDNGQQWDSPNGWAPLQWVTIQGLRNYGYHELAAEIKLRWLQVNEKVFKTEGKMIEKYDVVGESGLGGGGEYQLQDGFGWTNGVAAALLDE
ncbi:MAG TPA: alpha,alpha-trehalase TreF [Candidatus Saccharibacteria bacterium]|nr:alpha,alpha-trehalase TreF [Candidatus Saccharibacteria bacterium]